jgi:hypothetical protein
MELNEGMIQLNQLCKGKDWFFDIGTDTSGNYIVYVKFMDLKTLTFIPDTMAGRSVLVHFAASKLANKDQFINKSNIHRLEFSDETSSIFDTVEGNELGFLIKELDELKFICEFDILESIFWEVHDGPNSVTNCSAMFPEVRKRMEKLYDQYGFDVIHNEFES